MRQPTVIPGDHIPPREEFNNDGTGKHKRNVDQSVVRSEGYGSGRLG